MLNAFELIEYKEKYNYSIISNALSEVALLSSARNKAYYVPAMLDRLAHAFAILALVNISKIE